MERNPPAFVQVDTKNRAGLSQSLVSVVALPIISEFSICCSKCLEYLGTEPRGSEGRGVVCYCKNVDRVHIHNKEDENGSSDNGNDTNIK